MSSLKQIFRVTAIAASVATAVHAAPRTITIEVYSNKGEWNASTTYNGNYQTNEGDTVSYGMFNGKKLWWQAQHYVKGEMYSPGATSPSKSSTSPWVLLNSLSGTENGQSSYQWRGWNGDMETMTGLDAQIPTWRDGVEGAYTMTHDYFGILPFDLSVRPGWEVAMEFPEIKQAWGIYPPKMDSEEWDSAIKMVLEGHEMYSMGMDLNSPLATNFYYYPGDTIPADDYSVPYEFRGLTVVGLWNDPTVKISNGEETITFENELISVTCTPYWTLNAPCPQAPGTTTQVNGKDVTVIEPIIETKTGVEEVIHNNQKLYVKYVVKDVDGASGPNVGFIAAADISWYSPEQLDQYGEKGWSSSTENVAMDKGAPGFITTIEGSKGWDDDPENAKWVVEDASTAINTNLYEKIVHTGEHFRRGKRVEYFGFPVDRSSEDNYDILEDLGYVGARGGAITTEPAPGDFFHSYRVPFDNFYIDNPDWDVSKSEDSYNSPYMHIGLNEMVDSIISSKGYMIRSLSAVADIADGQWHDSTIAELWPLNNQGTGDGGWFGAITKLQLKRHYEYIQSKIDQCKLTVFTPSEAIKYRMTANAVDSAEIQKDGDNFRLSVRTIEDIPEKYRDEISVIVSLDTATDVLIPEYETPDSDWGITPRRLPRQMDAQGKIWSVSVNPYLGPVILKTNGYVSNKGIVETTTVLPQYKGIVNNKISLRLPVGAYKVELFTLQGRLVKTISFNAEDGIVQTPELTGIGSGFFLMNVTQKGKQVIPTEKIIVR